LRNPKTTRVVGTLTATIFSAAALSAPFTVLAAQDGAPLAPSSANTASVPSVTVPPAAVSAPLSAPAVIAPTLPPPAFPISLTDGANAAQSISTHGATVADALREAGITLSREDRVKPSPATPISPNMTIVVTRVRMALENTRASIPCGSVFRMSASVPPGHIRAGHAGEAGVVTKTFLVSYLNGHVTSRKLVSRVVTKKPRPRVTLAGIRVREARALPSRAGGYHRMECLTMTATGYSPYEGSGTGRCATGMRAGYGVVAVDPRVIPLGTRLYIEGYGYAVAGDTGGAIKGRRIDLGSTTRREAMYVGRRRVKVWVLNPIR
jgi:3D (Asp-Asp-Asp) domain-containing protein